MLNIFVSKEKREAEARIKSMLEYVSMTENAEKEYYAKYIEMKRAIMDYDRERTILWNKETDSEYQEMVKTRDYFKEQYDACVSDILKTYEQIKELRTKFGVA